MDSIENRWWLFHLFGGLDQFASSAASGWQFEMQSLATEAPDHHGAMMDAPEWFRNGEMRSEQTAHNAPSDQMQANDPC